MGVERRETDYESKRPDDEGEPRCLMLQALVEQDRNDERNDGEGAQGSEKERLELPDAPIQNQRELEQKEDKGEGPGKDRGEVAETDVPGLPGRYLGVHANVRQIREDG